MPNSNCVGLRAARMLILGSGIVGLCSCQSVSPTVARGPAALEVTGVATPGLAVGEYLLGPADVIDVIVAYEPELSLDDVTVDSNGDVSVPLIGTVHVAGATASRAAREIQSRFAGRYLRDPQVSVNVSQFARQSVTVEGSVDSPGVYKIPGSSSLIQTLALARGPTRVAKLDQVLVFRTVNGQRLAAVFDLRRIRYGYEPDPLIIGGDVVVVGYSEVKGAFRDFLTGAPALAVFRPY